MLQQGTSVLSVPLHLFVNKGSVDCIASVKGWHVETAGPCFNRLLLNALLPNLGIVLELTKLPCFATSLGPFDKVPSALLENSIDRVTELSTNLLAA